MVTFSRDARYGLRAIRVGEASRPGLGEIRRTQRLRALQRSMDMAEESDLETESLSWRGATILPPRSGGNPRFVQDWMRHINHPRKRREAFNMVKPVGDGDE